MFDESNAILKRDDNHNNESLLQRKVEQLLKNLLMRHVQQKKNKYPRRILLNILCCLCVVRNVLIMKLF